MNELRLFLEWLVWILGYSPHALQEFVDASRERPIMGMFAGGVLILILLGLLKVVELIMWLFKRAWIPLFAGAGIGVGVALLRTSGGLIR